MIPLAAINQLAAVYRGRGRNEAYLEFAQEHFLDWLRLEGLFEDDAVVFKGGTAIRKFVLGNEGRFSTDLDFAVGDPIYADHVLERLDQRVTHEGVTFVLAVRMASSRVRRPSGPATLPSAPAAVAARRVSSVANSARRPSESPLFRPPPRPGVPRRPVGSPVAPRRSPR